MSDMLGVIFAQLDKLLPERYRVRIVSCTALMGLTGWIYYSTHNFAKESDVQALKAQMGPSIIAAVAPITAQMRADEKNEGRHYLEDLSSQILQDAGRCSETQNSESRGLYEASLSQLLERYENTAGHPYPQAINCGQERSPQ